MMERQSTVPSRDVLEVSTPLGALHAEGVKSPPLRSATGPAVEGALGGSQYVYAPRFVDDVHLYIREHIRNGDQKAVFFFGATTALLAVLHSSGASSRWLKPADTWGLLDSVTFVGMLALALAALTSAWAVVPRLPGSKRGALYFNAIAAHESATEYAGMVLGAPERSLLTEKAEHCHILARICRTKYRVLRVSLWCSFIGVVCVLAYFLFD